MNGKIGSQSSSWVISTRWFITPDQKKKKINEDVVLQDWKLLEIYCDLYEIKFLEIFCRKIFINVKVIIIIIMNLIFVRNETFWMTKEVDCDPLSYSNMILNNNSCFRLKFVRKILNDPACVYNTALYLSENWNDSKLENCRMSRVCNEIRAI